MNNSKLLKSVVKHIGIALFAAFVMMVTSLISATDVSAKHLDEILKYEITVNVNDDATLDMIYEIQWKVLDSKSEGPLEWVKIGVPNKHVSNLIALTDNISKIDTMNSGGAYVRVDLDHQYFKDEVVDFAFKITVDNMYNVYPEESIVEYSFTPGWFEDIDVDKLVIRWNEFKNLRFSPSCLMEGDYLVWETKLDAGDKYTVTVVYPDDAYGFDLTKHAEEGSGSSSWNFSEHRWYENVFFCIVCFLMVVLMVAICFSPIVIPALIVFAIYKSSSGFKAQVRKSVTRTIIEYYPTCPNCGGTREEGKEVCSFCGTNMVKSREVVKDNELPDSDKAALDYSKDGEYRFSMNPNRFVRVNVINIPVSTRSYFSGTSRGTRSSGSHRSSCVHSSCACACACACAGGGRAGCSTKDFYNTNFKLSYLKKR